MGVVDPDPLPGYRVKILDGNHRAIGFCVALVAGNVYAGVKGALRATHGAEAVDGVSDDHLGLEVSGVRLELWIAVPEEAWVGMGGWSIGQMANGLVGLARRANLGRCRKATRGPKRPKPPRTRLPDAKHISTARLLNGEQQRCVGRDGRSSSPPPSPPTAPERKHRYCSRPYPNSIK